MLATLVKSVSSLFMRVTPLRLTSRSGDWRMVKLLLAKGASPNMPEYEFPSFLYTLSKRHDQVARALIEGGMDLHRAYSLQDHKATPGDLTALGGQTALVDLVWKQGGSFAP